MGQQTVNLFVGELVSLELQGHREAADVALGDAGIADYRMTAAYRANVAVFSCREQATVGDELLGLVTV